MNAGVRPLVLGRLGPLVLTDSLAVSVAISVLLIVGAIVLMRFDAARRTLEAIYEALERSIADSVQVDSRALVPLVLTLWAFLLVANLAGLVPTVLSPTRDLSITVALALIAFVAGHAYAFAVEGVGYLRRYLEPNPLMLPFNVIAELTRTLALALRLFGNMLSGHLVGAIAVYLAGALVPVPLLLLGVLTGVVQAYIFGVLTLVFTASSMQVGSRSSTRRRAA
ncbi:MAG: F0F1 ATP synthase subunit A [Sandaracinaceae bacterium]